MEEPFASSFLLNHDFAELVEEQVARKEIFAETMSLYFHAKIVVCERGKRRCPSFDHPPLELQANTREFK